MFDPSNLVCCPEANSTLYYVCIKSVKPSLEKLAIQSPRFHS